MAYAAPIYVTDFESFLRHTDEKEVLLREISRDVEECHAKSLLDIGAGNGLLTIPLSQLVRRYAAVEFKPNFVKRLKGEGIPVLAKSFPFPVGETFDFVLCSHAVLYHDRTWDPFLQAAWAAVRPGGTILLITYRGLDDNWTDFLHLVHEWRTLNSYRVGYDSMVGFLRARGGVNVNEVQTHVTTPTINSMAEVLSFVKSDGSTVRKEQSFRRHERVEHVLRTCYRGGGEGYHFLFQHFFISAKKPA